jgi:hypothetical protein
MEPITALGLSLYVGDKILESKIQGWYGKIKLSILGKETYQRRLSRLVQETINTIESRYPYSTERKDGFLAFYENQKIIDSLVESIFNEEVESFSLDIKEKKNLIPLEAKHLSEFVELLIEKISADKLLRSLKVEENYKEQIFQISDNLNEFISTFEKKIESIGLLLNSEEAFRILDRFSKHIQNFNPNMALKDIEWLEAEVDRKGISSKELKARIFYLKGMALKEMGDYESANQYFINSYRLVSTSKDYQEKAALLYFIKNDIELSNRILDKLLFNDPNNSVAWAIKTFQEIEKDNSSSELNFISRRTKKFKETLSYLCITKRKLDKLEIIFHDELKSFNPPEKITFWDKGYWINLAQFFINRALVVHLQSPYDLSKTELKKSKDINKANQILTLYIKNIKGTEKLKFSKHAWFLFCFTNFIIYRKKTDLENLTKFAEENNKDSIYIEEVASCLISEGLYQEANNLIENFEGEKNNSLFQYLTISNVALGNSNEARNAIISFLKNVEVIDQYGFIQLTSLVELTPDKNELHKYLETEILANKTFKFAHGKELLNAFILFFEDKEKNKSKILGIIEQIRTNFSEEFPNYPIIAANVCFALEEFDLAAKILEIVIGEFAETQPWRIYLSCLYHSKKNLSNFLSFAENWRDKFRVDFELLNFELDILQEIPDYPKINEICLIGIEYFPEFIRFRYFQIICLHKLKRKEELIEVLSSEDFQKMPQEALFSLVNIMVIEGYPELGIETLFQLATNPNNKKAREKYFHLFSYISRESPILISPDLAELNTTVVVKSGNDIISIQIDKISLKGDPRVKPLISRRVGDVIKSEELELEIVKIVNQYLHLQEIIANEIGDKPFSGYDAKKIPFDGKIEDFHQTLIDQFGKEGDARAYQNKITFKEYSERKIGLGILVRKILNGDFLLGYNILTSGYENGFFVWPKLLLESIVLDDDKDYVIDLSIIPLFYSLSIELKLSYKRKFFVSIFAKEFIEQKLIDIQLNYKGETQISFKIQSSGVNPSFRTQEDIESEIEYLNDLLSWIDHNCIVRPVYEKSEVVEELRKSSKGDLMLQDWQFKYYIDTLFLANHENTILISDDRSIAEFPHNSIRQISSEYFLEYEFGTLFSEKIIYSLLDRNYLGLKIKYEHLVSALYSSHQIRFVRIEPIANFTGGLLSLIFKIQVRFVGPEEYPDPVSTYGAITLNLINGMAGQGQEDFM